MQTFPKLLTIVILNVLLVFCLSCQTKIRFGEWTIENLVTNDADLSWSKFTWTDEDLGGKHFERTAMFIPLKIEGLPYDFTFQFDLGSNLTVLKENILRSIIFKQPDFNRIQDQNTFKNLEILFGNTKASTKYCYVIKDYEEPLSTDILTNSTPIHLGSIGADIFQNKILVIDYPNQQFAVCDALPISFKTSFTDISLDNSGRVILPLKVGEKTYEVMYDNGSSLFPLITTNNKISIFSTAASTDTIQISSWGTVHKVIGRPLKQKFQLAGQTFSDVTIYADFRQNAETNDYDAIAGNALFWDKTIIIDFKNKRFGVK